MNIKNITQFKKYNHVGMNFEVVSHSHFKDMIGKIRQVTKIQSNGFYSVIKDEPTNKYSMKNNGLGVFTDYSKAKYYQFDKNMITCFDDRNPTNEVLYKIKILED